MTLARVKDGKVVQIGVPKSIAEESGERMRPMGWRPVKGTPKPTDGQVYEYTHPYTYNADEDVVYGTWQQTDVLERINEAKAKGIREQRDHLLAESDFSVLPDSPVNNVDEWKVYRQALRDVPQQETFPASIEWPERPE